MRVPMGREVIFCLLWLFLDTKKVATFVRLSIEELREDVGWGGGPDDCDVLFQNVFSKCCHDLFSYCQRDWWGEGEFNHLAIFSWRFYFLMYMITCNLIFHFIINLIIITLIFTIIIITIIILIVVTGCFETRHWLGWFTNSSNLRVSWLWRT